MELTKTTQDVTRTTDLIGSFLSAQDVCDSSRRVYGRSLKQYFNWIRSSGHDIKTMNRTTLIQYKDDLTAQGKSSLTVSAYITGVRRFYEWAEAEKLYPNIAKGIKSPRRKQQFRKQPLTTTQAKALLSHLQKKAFGMADPEAIRPLDLGALRDFAIINLLIRTGLRTIEAARANIDDITYKGAQRVLMIQGKGWSEKTDFVILTDKTFKPISDYLTLRGSQSGPLFTSESKNSKGERLTTRSISRIAKSAFREIGLNEKALTAHSLRHTTAVNILRGGGTLEQAQYTLRHAGPATTQIYTATLNEDRRLENSGEALIDNLI